jgi:peptide/nickel transport system permease protein
MTLAAYPVSVLTRLLRISVLEELQRDYVRTARSKGVGDRTILVRHVLQNALGPFVAYVGVMIGFMLGSAIAIESVFAMPGAGTLALQSVGYRDLPVVNAFVAVVAVIIVVSNLLADLITIALDPVVRVGEPQLVGAAL